MDFLSLAGINTSVRVAQRPFYAAASHGFYGFIFADLNNHDFVIEREMSNRPTRVGPESATRSVTATTTKKENGKNIEMVTKREQYTPLLLVKDSPLPPDVQKNLRKLRKVHPLLTCVRALWTWQRENMGGLFPSHSSREDLAKFTTLATEKHKELQLPVETLKSDFLRSFIQNLGSELAPVTAFLGGQLAQDVINVLGQREQPIQNLMLFDGEESQGPIYALHPIFPENPLPPIAAVPTEAPVMIV